MTLRCWQHWFWITGVIPAVLLVLTSLRPSSASVTWEAPGPVWASTTWLQAGPPGAPQSWAIQRRLLGFAMPQPPGAAPGPPAHLAVAALPAPTIEAVVYTLSPAPSLDGDLHLPSVPSVAGAQSESSHVNTASLPSFVPTSAPFLLPSSSSPLSPTPSPSPNPPPSSAPTVKSSPSKPARPKVFKPYVASMTKGSMTPKPKVTSTSTNETSTSTSTTTVASTVGPAKSSTATSTTSLSAETAPETLTSTEGVIADPLGELMNDGPADVPLPAASASPETPTIASGTQSTPSSTTSSPSPFSSRMTSAIFTTEPTAVEEPHLREQTVRDLEVAHPGVSFDNVSKQHALSSNENYPGLDAGSITGIALGVVFFAALIGSASFVLYRRRFVNKPQTLNDKCSNPDSSGYIDDSTLRENSEEMYSLDNDSFLNSLEAMTIQNYWTDSVKHTKL